MHNQDTVKKIIEMHKLGLSSREISRALFNTESKKSTVNYIISRNSESEDQEADFGTGSLHKEFNLNDEVVIQVNSKDSKVFKALSSIQQTAEKMKKQYGERFYREPKEDKALKILFIPDCQVKSGVDLDYLQAIGEFAADKKPDVIVNAGDFWDFPSLSSYDKGKLSFEGRRLKEDIDAGIRGMQALMKPINEEIADSHWDPRLVFTLGNHEQRLSRVPSDNPEFAGFIGYDLLDLEGFGWEVHDFLKPVDIAGIFFVHYLQNPMTGKPYGGNALSQLKTVGKSFVVGHKQTLDIAVRPTIDGKMQLGLICGASYLHDEDYKGYQGNTHFRGVVMLHNAKDGFAEPMFVSTDYLIKKYI